MINEHLKEKSKKIYSYNTAISRSAPSAPTRWLENNGMIKGSVLDYGCGKGADARYLLKSGYSIDSYDPYWKPDLPIGNVYDTIYCNYVLNVLKKEDEQFVLDSIISLLSDDGKAYIAVRRDLKKDGKTSRGFQRRVFLNLPVLTNKPGAFTIYGMFRKN
jgi:ATP adenylyltransferase